MSHEQIFYFVSQLKMKVIITRELCFIASNDSLSIILVLLFTQCRRRLCHCGYLGLCSLASQEHMDSTNFQKIVRLVRGPHIFFLIHILSSFKSVHLDMLCVFCARLCVYIYVCV